MDDINDNLYTTPNRQVGSQSEIPNFILHDADKLEVSGYQGYIIKNKRFKATKKQTELKFKLIRSYLFPSLDKSILDLGCSSGALGIQCILEGHEKVTFVDHDPEYTEVITKVLDTIKGNGSSQICTSSFSGYQEKHDITIALAIIHWLYSYTEKYGSLSQIITKLKSLTRETLIIEWISENDPAILSKGHIFANPNSHQDPYNFAYFKAALEENFRYVRKIGKVNSTREIWIASDSRIRVDRLRWSIDFQYVIYKRLRRFLGKYLKFIISFRSE